MTTVAVLPVKRLGEAKQRLGDTLAGEARRELAEAMVGDVLDALRGAGTVDAIVVVTGEPAAAALATAAGAAVVTDPDDTGHVNAACRGVAWAVEHGATRALLVPGDCPALDPAEVDALLAEPGAAGSVRAGRAAAGVVVVPDRHGTGTNALLLAPPDAIEPAFGEGSRARHERVARASGHAVTIEPLGSLALDVDTPEDLEALRGLLARAPDRAPRTAAALAHPVRT